jgi:hypothetical protein
MLFNPNTSTTINSNISTKGGHSMPHSNVPTTPTWNVARLHNADDDAAAAMPSSVGHATVSPSNLPVSGTFKTTPSHTSNSIAPYQQSMPQRKSVMSHQAQRSTNAQQSSSGMSTAPAGLAQYSTTASNAGPIKHKLSQDFERSRKRPKSSYDADRPDLFEQHLGVSSGHGNQPTSPPSTSVSVPPHAHANALPPSPSSIQDTAQRPLLSAEDDEANDSDDGKDIKMLAVGQALAPQRLLGIKIIKKAKDVLPIATKTKYKKAEDDWLSQDELEAYEQTMIIKPRPVGGDVGVPQMDDGAAIDDWAKKFFDAMINNDRFWGSVKSPVTQLLQGKIDRKWVIKRSSDLAKEVVKYHTEGLEISIWANSKNLRANAASLSDIKAKNEQNDSFIVRMPNILYALQYHKGMVMDVLAAEKSLAYSIILATKARMLKKFAYKNSNYHRGEQTKEVKAKAAKWNEEHTGQ